jgi:hypothetical protein
MKLKLLNTRAGLVPLYDEDFDEKKKLTIGGEYLAEIKLLRNLSFHRKYFALINAAWAMQSEAITQHYKESIDAFRKSVEVAAGYYDEVYSLTRGEWLQVPKSIAFNAMDEAEFNTLYERVKDVLFAVFLKSVKEEEFLHIMQNF